VVTNATKKNDEGGENVRKYWRLEGLMAKYRIYQSDIAIIAEMSLPSVSKKFYKGEDFKIASAVKIAKYFRDKGETIDFEEYFCEPVVTNVNN